MNIVCATDENYLGHCMAMLQSLWHHNPDPDLHVYFMYDDIGSKQLGQATSFLTELLPAVSILKASAKPFKDFPVNGHVSVAAYFRLLVPELLPSSVTRALFIDADTIITAPLSELWQLPMQGKSLAAVPEHQLFCRDHDHEYKKYFNAGVMLIDLQEWRQSDLINKGLKIALESPEKLRHSDQDVLNIVYAGDWLPLGDRWNACPHLFGLTGGYDLSEDNLSSSESEAIRNPAIVHFAGSGRDKPWNARCRHPMRHHYLQARSHTPWSGEPLDDEPPPLMQRLWDQALFHTKSEVKRIFNN